MKSVALSLCLLVITALDDDQVRVMAVPTSTSKLLAERLTDIV